MSTPDTTLAPGAAPEALSPERLAEIRAFLAKADAFEQSYPGLANPTGLVDVRLLVAHVDALTTRCQAAEARLRTPGYGLGLSRDDCLNAADTVETDCGDYEAGVMRSLLHMVDDRDEQVMKEMARAEAAEAGRVAAEGGQDFILGGAPEGSQMGMSGMVTREDGQIEPERWPCPGCLANGPAQCLGTRCIYCPAAQAGQVPGMPEARCHGCGLPSHVKRCREAECPGKQIRPFVFVEADQVPWAPSATPAAPQPLQGEGAAEKGGQGNE